MKIKTLHKKVMREILPNDVEILGTRNLFEKDYEKWKELRNSFIGGSEAGAILGVSGYKNIVDVYVDKVHGSNFDGNEATFQGHRLEEWIAGEFINRNPNLEVLKFGYTLKKGNCGANVDFIIRDKITGDYGILEIKSGGERSLGNWEISHTEGEYTNIAVDVPQSYYAQVVHYLGVSGLKFGYIGAFIGNKYIQTPRFEATKEEVERVLSACEEMWLNHIVPKNPPMLADGGKGTDRLISAEFSPEDDLLVPLDENIDLVEEYYNLNAEAKKINQRLKEIKQELTLKMENSKGAEAGEYRIKRSTQVRSKFNKNRLIEDLGAEKVKGYYDSYKVEMFSIKYDGGDE